MTLAPAQSQAFRADRYTLGRAGLWLSPIDPAEAAGLAEALSVIDPWARYGTTPAHLAALFRPAADGGIRLAIRHGAPHVPVGVALVRHPWLAGPYLQFLALLPGHQGRGFGSVVLDWFEAEARAGGARNLWICAVAFNAGAQRLYARKGFAPAAVFDDLIKPGFDEILMRKTVTPSGS
jgi:diamine N-acetyltransferase